MRVSLRWGDELVHCRNEIEPKVGVMKLRCDESPSVLTEFVPALEARKCEGAASSLTKG
jgi:hypothetical protein